MTRPEEFIEPELTPGQHEIKEITDDILSQKPAKYLITNWDISTNVPADEVHEMLRTTRAGELLLAEGESMSARQPSEHWPDLNIYATQATLKAVGLRAWGWEYDKVRIDPEGPDSPPFDIILFPGEKDWSRQLDIKLRYIDDKQNATQTITSYTSYLQAGETPSLSRDVHTMAYAETGYEGHNQKFLEHVTDEEVLAFTGVCRYLLDNQSIDNI